MARMGSSEVPGVVCRYDPWLHVLVCTIPLWLQGTGAAQARQVLCDKYSFQADEDLPPNLQSVFERSQAGPQTGLAVPPFFTILHHSLPFFSAQMPSLGLFASSDTWKPPPLYQPRGNSLQCLAGTVNFPVHALCIAFDSPNLQMLYSTNGETKAAAMLICCISSLTNSSDSHIYPVFPTLLCFTLFFRLGVIHSDFAPWTAKFCTDIQTHSLWNPAYGSSGFPKSSFPATQISILHVYFKKTEI